MERFWFFLGPLALLIIAEAVWPRRHRTLTRAQRWPGAVLLLGSGMILMRLAVPAGLIGLSLWADTNGFGLFNVIEAPLLLVALAGYIAFDLAVWAQHVAMHRWDMLWRFHRVHHADPDIDVVTALRFHPGEMIVSLAWKGAIVLALGAPAICVFWYEILLNVGAMFNHANIRLPNAVDRILRWIIVTPDMHRVHHSTDHKEANQNFGFLLPWWDHLFQVYQAQPEKGHDGMEIGQKTWRKAGDQSIWALLTQPRFKP